LLQNIKLTIVGTQILQLGWGKSNELAHVMQSLYLPLLWDSIQLLMLNVIEK